MWYSYEIGIYFHVTCISVGFEEIFCHDDVGGCKPILWRFYLFRQNMKVRSFIFSLVCSYPQSLVSIVDPWFFKPVAYLRQDAGSGGAECGGPLHFKTIMNFKKNIKLITVFRFVSVFSLDNTLSLCKHTPDKIQKDCGAALSCFWWR
jgi:hypothetical protein